MTDDNIRVLLVDDQALVRAGFRIILESEPGIIVVGEASDGASAIEKAQVLDPDVICMDVQMPGMDGLAATRAIVADPGVHSAVLMLTTFDELTERETTVFTLLAQGMSNAEIAGRLFLGESTIKTHVSRLLLKLDLRDRTQAVVYAYEQCIVVPGAPIES